MKDRASGGVKSLRLSISGEKVAMTKASMYSTLIYRGMYRVHLDMLTGYKRGWWNYASRLSI